MQVSHVYTCSKILHVLSTYRVLLIFCFLRPQIKITNKIMVVFNKVKVKLICIC